MRHVIGLATLLALGVFVMGCEVRYVEPPAATPPEEAEEAEELPPIERAATPLAPVIGGGLLITRDEHHAIIADVDRDLIWVVDMNAQRLIDRIDLEPGDRPNRLAEDAQGRVHVALRRGGAVVTLDLRGGGIVRRTAVCPAPRGIAHDFERDRLYVACLHGELVELDPETHAERRRVTLEPDLRDVVVDGDRVLVSTFRSAEVFAVDDDGAVSAVPAAVESHPFGLDGRRTHSPRVAWRMVRALDGTVRLLHQRHRAEPLPDLSRPNRYYDTGGCANSVLHATVATVGTPRVEGEPPGALPAGLLVDFAVNHDGRIAVVDPMATQAFFSRPWELGCSPGDEDGSLIQLGAGATAVAWWRGHPVVFDRFATNLLIYTDTAVSGGDAFRLTFDAPTRESTGHRLFHETTNSGIACASCHPEGGEDGHVWDFAAFGPRRTQSLLGGVSGRAPLHWSGDLADFGAFMDEVFVSRMGGDRLHPLEIDAMVEWLDSVPHLPPVPVADPVAVDRGAAVFDAVGCRDCHFTDGTVDPDSHDVGTGEPLQVPSLVGAALRLPLMHDGCAETLAGRFDPACGGEAHGLTGDLSAIEQADLVAYLRSL